MGNVFGDSVLQDYAADNYCSKLNGPEPKINRLGLSGTPFAAAANLFSGGGSLFHQVPFKNSPIPEHNYFRTELKVMAPASGKLLWMQSHLHTGGVNATFYKNGEILCSNDAIIGTDPNPATNARNEENHLVRITSCYDQLPLEGIQFEYGDVFEVETYYYAGIDDDRFSNPLQAAGEHKNAMSMFFTGVVFDGDSEFLTIPKRSSFDLWNDFVHVAGIRYFKKKRQNKNKRWWRPQLGGS